jgi:hypothetical protein
LTDFHEVIASCAGRPDLGQATCTDYPLLGQVRDDLVSMGPPPKRAGRGVSTRLQPCCSGHPRRENKILPRCTSEPNRKALGTTQSASCKPHWDRCPCTGRMQAILWEPFVRCAHGTGDKISPVDSYEPPIATLLPQSRFNQRLLSGVRKGCSLKPAM